MSVRAQAEEPLIENRPSWNTAAVLENEDFSGNREYEKLPELQSKLRFGSKVYPILATMLLYMFFLLLLLLLLLSLYHIALNV